MVGLRALAEGVATFSKCACIYALVCVGYVDITAFTIGQLAFSLTMLIAYYGYFLWGMLVGGKRDVFDSVRRILPGRIEYQVREQIREAVKDKGEKEGERVAVYERNFESDKESEREEKTREDKRRREDSKCRA